MTDSLMFRIISIMVCTVMLISRVSLHMYGWASFWALMVLLNFYVLYSDNKIKRLSDNKVN